MRGGSSLPDLLNLLLASLVTLYFELLVIRYLSTEVRIFTNLKNLPLIASFFGIGLGMILGRPGKWLRGAFPIIAFLLFILIRFASWLHLPAVDVSWNYGLGPRSDADLYEHVLHLLRFVVTVLGFSAMVVVFFVVLGGFVGEYLRRMAPLKGYGVNLLGSLSGVALFSVLALINSRPAFWLLIGFALLIPFFARQRTSILLFVVTLGAVAIPEPNTLWSPYYRIDFTPLPSPAGWPGLSAYSLVSNHVWYQWIVDLSPDFVSRYPAAEPNRAVLPYYELPYRLVPSPTNVLIVGAGTGNDVAAALRHGAGHVDAVELDPVISRLGQQYHPEHPYSSSRVTVYVDDARAFLKKTTKKYDLVVFAFLDSTTLLSGFSSLRLDNYVYTLESFQNARDILARNGTLALSFATGRSFATDRLYATLEKAFGVAPASYLTGYYVHGVLLVQGGARDTRIPELPDVSEELRAHSKTAILAADRWPFLYLESRSIPDSILMAEALFLLVAWIVLRRTGLVGWRGNLAFLHFFFLGAGFLLLETKAVTQLALLFGSTWIVNSVVIASFLLMAMLSNTLVIFSKISRTLCYGPLLLLLSVDLWFPYSSLNGASFGTRVLVAGGWVALPVFFSGVIFSCSVKEFDDPAKALGINLFGAVIGGVLENAVMIGGTQVLALLAMLLYAGSAIVLSHPRRRRQNASATVRA